MTLNEFINELSQIKGFEFSPNPTRRGNLRKRTKRCVFGFCPITAVAFRKTRLFFHVGDFDEAAKQIGLSLRNAKRVAAAADEYGTDSKLRARLIAALGL